MSTDADTQETTTNVFGGYKNAHRQFIEAPGKGRARAIRMKCAECVNFEAVVKRVRECQITNCALHHIRPYQQKAPK